MKIEDIIELGSQLEDMIKMLDDLFQFEVLYLSHQNGGDYFVVDCYGNEALRISEKLYEYLSKRLKP